MLAGVLRTNRDFRRSFLADLTSNLGSAMSTIAYPLLVLSLGGNAAQAGAVATVALVTRLGFRLPAGGLVDRWNRRRVMLTTDLVRLVAVATIPLVALWGSPSYAQLLLVAAVEGIATAMFGPANTVLTRDVVAKEDLADALGMGQALQAAVSLAGPALGGVLYAADRMLPFAVDALSYAVSAALIWRITVRPTAAEPRAEDRGLTAGIRWLVRRRELFVILVYAAAINLVAAAIDVIVILELRANGASGWVIGPVLSCAGVGGIVGSLLAPWFVKRLSVPTILLGIGVGWTAVLAVFTLTFAPGVVAALLTLLMMLSPAAGVVVGHALFGQTPRHLIGRVSAATGLLLSGLAALGPVAAGALLQGLGGAGTWAVMAVLTAAVTAGGWIPLRTTQRLAAGPAADGDAQPAPGPPATPDLDAQAGPAPGTRAAPAPEADPEQPAEPAVVAHAAPPAPGRAPAPGTGPTAAPAGADPGRSSDD
ncbi:MFS transporter [Kitasatospora sp. NPDC001603]|uniref:MFS transporter n=1 Tax=Kitasatospora sp. NPDC001603 TaxID=3154388 RepID=UPI00331922D2